MMTKSIIEVKAVNKVFNPGMDNELHVLKDINLGIERGSFNAILGPSGSGKTTLLDMMGCLLKPTNGEILIDGVLTNELNDNELAHIRREKIGFVFQQYNLISSQTALENVELPMRIAGVHRRDSRKRGEKLLRMVGLGERMKHRPPQLSGGEQQRVAIARSLANNPRIIMGDEPTGNLDSKTGIAILDLMRKLNRENGYTIIVVTHDLKIKKYAKRIIRLMDGRVVR
jgi:putative ABC transport system ATP-binding protein